MNEKVGRNDPCPCGSGKKYKNCHLLKEKQAAAPAGLKKFKAKLISGGGTVQAQQQTEPQQGEHITVDYNLLMERAFGDALHTYQDKPPVPSNPSKYLVKEDESQ